jgi:hypothetical protein
MGTGSLIPGIKRPGREEQSSNLLLAFASTVILVLGPVGTHDHIFVLTKIFMCFETRHSLRREEGGPCLSRAVICCWPSLAQSFLVLGPVGTHDHIFVLTKIFVCFETRHSLRREQGGPCLSRAVICCSDWLKLSTCLYMVLRL